MNKQYNYFMLRIERIQKRDIDKNTQKISGTSLELKILDQCLS
jgi:hypothetical protein